MIQLGDREIAQIFLGNGVVAAIDLGAKLVWTAITSCFGSGWWIDDAPWRDDEAWKD